MGVSKAKLQRRVEIAERFWRKYRHAVYVYCEQELMEWDELAPELREWIAQNGPKLFDEDRYEREIAKKEAEKPPKNPCHGCGQEMGSRVLNVCVKCSHSRAVLKRREAVV